MFSTLKEVLFKIYILLKGYVMGLQESVTVSDSASECVTESTILCAECGLHTTAADGYTDSFTDLFYCRSCWIDWFYSDKMADVHSVTIEPETYSDYDEDFPALTHRCTDCGRPYRTDEVTGLFYCHPACWMSDRMADVPNELKADGEFMLAIVKHSEFAVDYASEVLREDREFMLATVRQNGWALSHMSEEFTGDREIVMAAVRQNGMLLSGATVEMRADREIVWTALVQINSPLNSSWSEMRFWLSEETLRLMPVHFRLILGRFVKSEHPVLSEVPIELFERIGEMFTKEFLTATLP
jgi:hypothetical protein